MFFGDRGLPKTSRPTDWELVLYTKVRNLTCPVRFCPQAELMKWDQEELCLNIKAVFSFCPGLCWKPETLRIVTVRRSFYSRRWCWEKEKWKTSDLAASFHCDTNNNDSIIGDGLRLLQWVGCLLEPFRYLFNSSYLANCPGWTWPHTPAWQLFSASASVELW